MTYSIDFRKQVLRSIKDGMTIREAANFYQLSTSSIHSWQQSLVPKTTRNKAPTKISNQALLKDVEQHPDDYMYERARRLGCSKSGIEAALKRLGISQKKDLRTSKSLFDKKMLFALDYFEQNINSHIFYDWCKFTLIPSLKTKCVIVMDNARFHKSKRIQKLLNRHAHRILWLPPYSPDLNPIEKKWAQAKFLRQGWMENNLPELFYDMGCSSFIVD